MQALNSGPMSLKHVQGRQCDKYRKLPNQNQINRQHIDESDPRCLARVCAEIKGSTDEHGLESAVMSQSPPLVAGAQLRAVGLWLNRAAGALCRQGTDFWTAGVQNEDSGIAWNGAGLDGEQVAGRTPGGEGVRRDRSEGDRRHRRGIPWSAAPCAASRDHRHFSATGLRARHHYMPMRSRKPQP